MKQVIASFVVIMVLASGCGKDHTIITVQKSAVKLLNKVSVSYPLSTSNTSYQYNKNNTLAAYINGDIECNYNYTANKITYTIGSVSSGKRMYTLALTLNKKGLMTAGSGQLLYNPSAPLSFTSFYEYDDNGYLVKQTTQQQNHTYTKTFVYTNGDLTTQRCYTDDKLQYTVTYYYEKPVDNKLNVMQVADFTIPANSFSGKTSKHLWTRAEQVNTNGQKGYTKKEYTLDSDGYPQYCACKSNNISYTEYYYYAAVK